MVSRNLSEYRDLIQEFVNRRITVGEFERGYLRMFKDDATIRSEGEYEILNQLFGDVDAFSSDADLRSADGLDEEQLRAAANGALIALSAIRTA